MIKIPILSAGQTPTPAYCKALKVAINSDGCSDVPDLYVDCCILHDLAYGFGINHYGLKMKKSDADALLRRCMQCKSPLGRFSVISWTYWFGVHFLGYKAYADDVDKRTDYETYLFS